DQSRQQNDNGIVQLAGGQRGIRLNANVPLGVTVVSLSAEEGVASGFALAAPRAYFNVGGAARFTTTRASFSLFGQRNDGNTLGGAGRASMTGGASTQIQLTSSLSLVTMAMLSTVSVP